MSPDQAYVFAKADRGATNADGVEAEPLRPPHICVEVTTDLESIEALGDEWNKLEALTPEATGFQSYWWCNAWIEAIRHVDRLAPKPLVILVRENGRLVWLLPLQVERRYGIRWARALGQPVTQYADALAIASPRRATWRAAADLYLKKQGKVDVVSMVQIRVDGVLAGTPGKSALKAVSCAPFLDLTEDMAVSQALAVGKGQRRRHRLLDRAAPITFTSATSSDDSKMAVRQALQQKRAWLQTRHLHTCSFLLSVSQRFLEGLAARGNLQVWRLNLDTCPVAFEVGFIDRATYRSLLAAYDLNHAYGAPGHKLTRYVIEDCRARGLARFDLLAPNEPYKRAISNKSIDVASMHQSFTKRGDLGMLASLRLRTPFYAISEMRAHLLFVIRAWIKDTLR